MLLRLKLKSLYFLQFFVWGAWLISLGAYLSNTLHFTGTQIGSIYATMGVAALFMPALLGVLADKWIRAEILLGLCHLLAGGVLVYASTITDYQSFYIAMLLQAMLYMPTISLAGSVSYNALTGEDLVAVFPPIRVWGTVGFIAAMWLVDLSGWSLSANQLMLGGFSALVLGAYSFAMPACKVVRTVQSRGIVSRLGLDAFVLFKNKNMAVFLVFSMLLGAALQITNAFGEVFLHDFSFVYPQSWVVEHPGILMSVSQISETLFLLTIPFFLKRFGIKTVMLMSMLAWVLRFGLFGIANPDAGFAFLILSMIVYGMAFDFFNISGSLYIETQTSHSHRASAQGLFMLMTNGLGALLGGWGSGLVVDYFTTNQQHDWPSIWFSFAGYALVLAIVFFFVFKDKHIKRS